MKTKRLASGFGYRSWAAIVPRSAGHGRLALAANPIGFTYLYPMERNSASATGLVLPTMAALVAAFVLSLRSLSVPGVPNEPPRVSSSLPLLFALGRFATFLFFSAYKTQAPSGPCGIRQQGAVCVRGACAGAAQAAGGRVSAKLGRCMSLSSSLPRLGYCARQAMCGKRNSSQPSATPTAMSDRLRWMPLQ